MPVAKARSFFGNHSATDLMEAGKLPASPSPRAKRTTPKPRGVRAKAWAIVARLQKTMAAANPSRVPNRSRSPPTTSMPRA
jgi:hypothetical protein